MKNYLPILLLLLVTLSAGAQVPDSDTLPASAAPDPEGNDVIVPKRMQTHLTLGSQFSTSSYYGSGLTTFISPMLSYRVSPRFSVSGGLRISNTALFNFRPWYETGPSRSFDANFTRALIYLEGSYRVTDRLTISGVGFKEFTLSDNSAFYNPYTRGPHDGIYLNADYEISEGVHIQAGFGYTRGYSPYMGSPLYDPSPFSGGAFHHTPFQRNAFNNSPLNW